MAEFNPVKKVTDFNPVKKSSTPRINIDQTPVPEGPKWMGDYPNLAGLYGAGKEVFGQAVVPTLKGAGLALGGLYGGIPGASLGYGIGANIGRQGEDLIAQLGGEKVQPQSVFQSLVQSGKDIKEGAEYETGGRIIGAALPPIVTGIGRVGSQAVGRLTGTGAAAVKEAYKSGADATKIMFQKALRGKLSGEEVVGIARNSLNKIKDTRAVEYQKSLAKISEIVPGARPQRIDINPIKDKLEELLGQYNIKQAVDNAGNLIFDKAGKPVYDTSRVAMGKKGIRDLREIIKKINEWGDYEEDFTAKGLDTLKRQLDDFWSDSSQARQFVTSMRGKVKDTIVSSVPEYEKMTKNYSEATSLIKDIESNLMMRKQGMSGRIVSDQTLRRLMSAMKDNFELRNELVGLLSNRGGQDVMGAVAGHTMRSWMPRGLAGTGPALVGNIALAKIVHPAFWPVVAASSPRVAAEFIRMLGKFSGELAGIEGAVGRSMAAGLLPKLDFTETKEKVIRNGEVQIPEIKNTVNLRQKLHKVK